MFYIGFPMLSLIYIIILLIVYFSKERINLFENKVVSALMIINSIGLMLELLCYVVLVFLKIQDTTLGMTILKSYIFYMYIFDWVLTGYICMLTSKNYDTENYDKKAYFKKSLTIFSPIVIIGFIITFITKLNYYNISPKYYTYGLSTDFLVYFTSILAPFWIYRCIKVSLTKKSRDYNIRIGTILLGIILVGISGALIQLVDRSMLILTSAHTIMLVLVYFTIENPDMQMIKELNKNKKLTEQNFEEKSNFLFKISQDLKQPLKEMTTLSQEIIEKNNIEENAKKINLNSKQLYTYVNSALDVSQIDIKNLKILTSTYNANNFVEEIKRRVKAEITNQNKKIEFRTNISKNIPKYLSGDNTKIKQIILSILFNSIKHTDEGFIELNINTIIKYGVCRLLIEISDCGGGMTLDTINKILNIKEELTPSDIEKIDKLNIDLILAHKMIKVLNGNFIIKSEEKLGTNFLIIIDQKIEEKNDKSIDKYSKMNQEKILLISDDEKLVEEIKSKLNNIEQSLYIKDAKEKIINTKIKCILIDNELMHESAINIFKEINTDIPSIIILNDKEKFMSKHYIEDGFKDFMIKEYIEDELNKINKL